MTPPLTAVVHLHSYQPVAFRDTTTTTTCTEELEPPPPPPHSSMEISIDDAMERLGLGWWQYIILAATGLSYAADGMQVILLSFLTPVWQQEWGLSATQTASLSATLFLGAFGGTLTWGPLADRIGRRPVVLLATLVIAVASGTLSFQSHYTGMLVTIGGIGFGVGGLTIPFDILAEFLPTHRRGPKLLEINYAWTMGVLYVVAGAYLFLHAQPTSAGWRHFVRWCSLPCFLSLIIGVALIPESPRWLTSQGRGEEAMRILRRAERTNFTTEHAIFPEQMTLKCEAQDSRATLSDLFRPQWIGLTLWLWGAWFTFSFGYFGTVLITTRIFSSSVDQDATLDTTTQFDFSAIFITTLAEFVGTTMAIVMIDRMGRIRSQVVSFLTAGVFLLLFCVLAQWNAKRWVLLLAAFIARSFEMTATCILWAATAEILNTEIRGAGHSSSNAMARIGAIFCPLLVQNTTSLIQVGVTMCMFHGVTAFCVSRLPETNGRAMGFGYSTGTATPE